MGVWQTTYGDVHGSGQAATAAVRERDGMGDGSARLLPSSLGMGSTVPGEPDATDNAAPIEREMREVVVLTVYLHVRQPYNESTG
jgi:hypothetical protein